MSENEISKIIVDSAIEVHRPGNQRQSEKHFAGMRRSSTKPMTFSFGGLPVHNQGISGRSQCFGGRPGSSLKMRSRGGREGKLYCLYS
jgi:hypothetical protein